MKKLFTLMMVLTLTLSFSGLKAQSGLFISEVGDPSDDYNGRFVELFNASTETIDFGTVILYLSRQSNGGSTWGDVQITGTIAAGQTFVLGGSGFEAAFGSVPDQVVGILNSNGDDAYSLYLNGDHSAGTVFDIYGAIDTDGTGQAWEFLDGGAYRNSDVLLANTTWTASEWTVTMPMNVADFTPGVHTAGADASAPVATFLPATGTNDVAVDGDIVITFDEPIFNADGSEITDPSNLVQLSDVPPLKAVIPSSVTIDDTKQIITIDPTDDLTGSTIYQVTVLAGMIEDEAGNEAAQQDAVFITIDAGTPVLELTHPVGGEAFYLGQETHIDWTAANVDDFIDIEVSFDNGLTFESVADNVSSALGTYDFTIPGDSPVSFEVILSITESSASSPLTDQSEVYTVVPMFAITEIQGNTETNGNSVHEDTTCFTSGIVVFANGKDEYFISDGVGGDYSGIVVRDDVNMPVVGDSLVLAGKVAEYYGFTQFGNILSYEVAATGKAVPAPVAMATNGGSEALESVIVKVSSAVVVTATSSYGETEVDDGSGVVLVDDPYFAPTLNLDGTYDIAGPLGYSYNKWRVYPTADGDVVEILSDKASVTSAVYTVDGTAGTIVDIPALEDLATFKTNIVPVYGATFEVYEADGTTMATDLLSDYKLIVTSQNTSVTKTYTITKSPLSTDATVSSVSFTVDDGAETIMGVLYKSNVADFEARIIPAAGASFATFEADGTTAATDLMTGYKLIATAEDATTTKTYTITLDDAMPADLIFSEYIEGSGNNKAMEIFNPNDVDINLDYYQLAQISNGGDDWEYFHVFPAGTVLEALDAYVILNSETTADNFNPANADEVMDYPSPVHHNGDDARGLVIVTSVDTTLVDIIGDFGPDPGDGWEVAGVADATKDHTLLRKGTVSEGNTDWTSSAGTTADDSEWIVMDQNFFDSLGVHFLVEPEPSHDATLSALAVDGTGVAGFSPAALSYYVTLTAGTTTAPAVTATATADGLATIAIADATDVTSTDAAARTTTVTVTAEDGIAMKSYTIEFTVEVGIGNMSLENLNVYPVPASDQLYISGASSAKRLTVYDITGSVVREMNDVQSGLISVDVSALNNGVYFIKLENENATEVVRFVKR